MLPLSYDLVSEKTKQTIQLFIARASGFLQGKGMSEAEVHVAMDKIEKEAIKEVFETEVELWKKPKQLCNAEQFVQRFADLVWEAVVGDEREEGQWPYDFTTPDEEGRLSTELVDVVTHALQTNEEDTRAREDAKTEHAFGKKRKNAEPESTTTKRRRGNEGQKMSTRYSTQQPKDGRWAGVPLAEREFRLMNAGLMEAIWEARIYSGDNTYHDAGVFAVKIPKEKAWVVLGHNFHVVKKWVRHRWYPLQLYTCDLGHALQVGLWVTKSESRGQKEDTVRYKSEELYNLLRHWSFQVCGTSYQQLANYLKSYLEKYGSR